MSKKKKNVDFQKVRIKVGRKLKRQNETVVDLIRKKIKLPRERETFQEEESIKQASRILDVAIDSLNLEKPVLQLEALRSLNSILDPFAKQLMLFTHSTHSHLTLQSCSMKSLLLIYRALLQSDKPSDLGLQLGDLLSVLTRVCRGAQDPGICVDLFKLFLNIVKLFSFHPNFPDLLRTVHQCAIALLQRVESSWFWLGCKLTCLVLQKHCELVSLFTEVHHDRGVSRFADPMEQLVRCSLLSRCLSQLYAHLRQASIRDRSNDRINLLETTLAYFKDDQYSMYSACTGGSHPFVFHPPSIPSDTNSRILTYIPLNGLNLCQFANWNETTTSMDLSFIEMETPKLLFSKMKPYASALTPSKKPKGATKAEFRGKVNYNLTRPALGDERQRHEQAVLVGMLNEGFHLLDDLSRGPEAPVFLGLFYVIRCLRVLFEHKPWIFSSQNRSESPSSDTKSSTDIQSALGRFIRRLLCAFPIELPNQTDEVEADATKRYTVPLGLSNRETKRAKKRMTKFQKRAERRQLSISTENTNSATTANPRATRFFLHPRPVVSIHLLNQSVLELCTHLERLHSSYPLLGHDLWPPPPESQEHFAKLISGFTQYGITLPPNVLQMWLRSFDLYLLTPIRNPRDFSLCTPQSRLFTAPILVCLHGLLNRLERTVLTHTSGLLPRHHRILGRTVGILTAFFTHALRWSLTRSQVNSDHNTNDEEIVTEAYHPESVFYDESWIRQQVTQLDADESTQSSGLLSTLVRILTRLVDTEPPRVLFATPLSDQCSASVVSECMQQYYHLSLDLSTRLIPIHMVETTWASCLNRLISLRCAPAVEAASLSPELKAKLDLVRHLECHLVPLTSLVNKLNLTLPTELGADGIRQFGWVVPGYLPSTTGRYASAAFWRAGNKKDRWCARVKSCS